MIYTYVAAGIAGLAIGFAGAWNVQGWRMGEQIAQVKRAQATAAANALQAARDQEQRRIAALTKEAEDAHAREESARADAGAARTAGERLRAQLVAARAAACRGATTPAAGSPAGQATDLLDDVQRRLDEAADEIARFADLAHSAGTACERSYDALRR